MGFPSSSLMRGFSQLPPAEPCSYICPTLITKEQTTGPFKDSSVTTLSHQIKPEYQKLEISEGWGKENNIFIFNYISMIE